MAPGRNLQQEAPRITSVTSGQELIDAVIDGAQHIRIEQHLDLTLPSHDAQTHPISDADTTFHNFYRYAGYIDTSRTDTVMVGPFTLDMGPLSGDHEPLSACSQRTEDANLTD